MKFSTWGLFQTNVIQWLFSPKSCSLWDDVEKFARGRLLNDLKDKREYWKLKEKQLGRTLWRTRYGRGDGLVVRQTAACMNANQKGHKWLPQFDLLQFSVGQKKTSWYGVTLSKGGNNSDQTRGGGDILTSIPIRNTKCRNKLSACIQEMELLE